MAIELRGFDDLQDDLINMAAALEQGPGVTRALQAGAAPHRRPAGQHHGGLLEAVLKHIPYESFLRLGYGEGAVAKQPLPHICMLM